MSLTSRQDYVKRQRERYAQAGRAYRKRLLDELCETCGYERKYAIKLLNGRRRTHKGKPGRKPEYTVILEPLKQLWLASGQLCGKRLKAALPLLLPYYPGRYGSLSKEQQGKLLKISAAQIDRLLAPSRIAQPKKHRGCKPGSLLKREIPYACDSPAVPIPGYMEVDTVAHCGGNMAGSFVWSLTYTCVNTGWTENRAMWNRSGSAVVKHTKLLERNLPFELLGLDFDNGGEFINKVFIAHGREREKPLKLTRSRAYRKNDNAHVEQKNWTHVRELLGYERYGNPRLVRLMNELYEQIWNPWQNYFCPSMKLRSKRRIGSKYIKQYAPAQTPCSRLLNSNTLTRQQKSALKSARDSLNPFDLRDQLDAKLGEIIKILEAATTSGGTPRRSGS